LLRGRRSMCSVRSMRKSQRLAAPTYWRPSRLVGECRDLGPRKPLAWRDHLAAGARGDCDDPGSHVGEALPPGTARRPARYPGLATAGRRAFAEELGVVTWAGLLPPGPLSAAPRCARDTPLAARSRRSGSRIGSARITTTRRSGCAKSRIPAFLPGPPWRSAAELYLRDIRPLGPPFFCRRDVSCVRLVGTRRLGRAPRQVSSPSTPQPRQLVAPRSTIRSPACSRRRESRHCARLAWPGYRAHYVKGAPRHFRVSAAPNCWPLPPPLRFRLPFPRPNGPVVIPERRSVDDLCIAASVPAHSRITPERTAP